MNGSITLQRSTAGERELGEVIRTFNDVTERMKVSHERNGWFDTPTARESDA